MFCKGLIRKCQMRLLTKACCIALPFCIVPLVQATADDFRIIKDRVIAELMKSPVDDGHVEALLRQMNEDGSFAGINYKDLSRTAGFPQRDHTSHLVDLARAYKSS